MAELDNQRVDYESALKTLFENITAGTGSGGGTGTGGTILPSRLSIINYVKAKLDELIPEGEGVTFSLSSEPNITDPLDLLINVHLDECTKDVILSAPISVLFPISVAGNGTAIANDTKTGFVVLPDNFLRLSSFKMSEWKREATIITPQSSIYKRQSIVGLRGGISKPIAVMTWRTVSDAMKRVLEYYTVNTSHAIEKLLYIPETIAEDFIAAGRNPNLLDALAWMAAGKIMQITGMVNEAKIAQERVIQSYNNL